MTTATTEALKLTDRINRIEPSATMAVVAEADKLRAQLVSFGHDRHGGGGLNAVDAVGEFQRFAGRSGHDFFFLFFSRFSESLWLRTSIMRASRSL